MGYPYPHFGLGAFWGGPTLGCLVGRATAGGLLGPQTATPKACSNSHNLKP